MARTLKINAGAVVYPQIAAAALAHKDQSHFRAFLVLKWLDRNRGGEGCLSRELVEWELCRTLNLSRSRIRVLLAEGRGRYWRQHDGSLYLISDKAVAFAYGIDGVSTPREVAISELRTKGSTTAALLAAQYDPDGTTLPTSRARIAERTGISPRHQRRLARKYGYEQKVQEVHVAVPRSGRRGKPGSGGHYTGRSGELMRRHPDIRKSTQTAGSVASRKRVNRGLKKYEQEHPASKSTRALGLSTYFLPRDGWKKWQRQGLKARGWRKDDYGQSDYAVIAYGPPGRLRCEAVCGEDVFSMSDSSD